MPCPVRSGPARGPTSSWPGSPRRRASRARPGPGHHRGLFRPSDPGFRHRRIHEALTAARAEQAAVTGSTVPHPRRVEGTIAQAYHVTGIRRSLPRPGQNPPGAQHRSRRHQPDPAPAPGGPASRWTGPWTPTSSGWTSQHEKPKTLPSISRTGSHEGVTSRIIEHSAPPMSGSSMFADWMRRYQHTRAGTHTQRAVKVRTRELLAASVLVAESCLTWRPVMHSGSTVAWVPGTGRRLIREHFPVLGLRCLLGGAGKFPIWSAPESPGGGGSTATGWMSWPILVAWPVIRSFRARLAADGYVFLRGLGLPAEQVRAAGELVAAKLRAGGWTAAYCRARAGAGCVEVLADPAYRAAVDQRGSHRDRLYLAPLRGTVRLHPRRAFPYPVKVLRAVGPEVPAQRPGGPVHPLRLHGAQESRTC